LSAPVRSLCARPRSSLSWVQSNPESNHEHEPTITTYPTYSQDSSSASSSIPHTHLAHSVIFSLSFNSLLASHFISNSKHLRPHFQTFVLIPCISCISTP
jgi:hypothetical protein